MAGHSQWANIKHRKGSQDQKRAKIFQKILRQLQVAVKQGGIDLDSNSQLRLIIDRAKAVNMPKENITRALKKFSVTDVIDNYETICYEGYGPGKVAIIIECLSNNRNRTASNIRSYFNKYGGSLGVSGSVKYFFNKVGLFVFKQNDLLQNDVWNWVVEIDALDFEVVNDEFIITSSVENFWKTKNFLEQKGITSFNFCDLSFQPLDFVIIKDDELLKKFWDLVNILEDDDDVQNVYYNLEAKS